MADRNKGTFAFSANFEVKMQALLDPRGGVTNKSELINKETFPYDGDTIYMKEGMMVTVSSEQSVYMLVSLENILASDYSGWKRIDAGAAEQVEVVDNLTSTSATSALSANQGKVLMGYIDALHGKVSSIYTPKGSKAFAELPTEGNNIGDVYNITDAFTLDGKPYPAGTNVAWTGTAWDALGGWVDFSNYYTKEEVNGIESNLRSYVGEQVQSVVGELNTTNQNLNTLSGKVSANEGKLSSLEATVGTINLTLTGNPEVEGDGGVIGRLEAAETANTEQNTRLTNLEKLVSGGEAGEGGTTLLEMVNTNTANIATLTEAHNQTVQRVQILMGNAETAGSVDYKIAQAFKWVDVE
ncbi:MAG: hypothetical protein IKY94_11470 [Lachnospiraceae bacterium]|nr:hypothetical protein [Lachnospiraceae bacterium]